MFCIKEPDPETVHGGGVAVLCGVVPVRETGAAVAGGMGAGGAVVAAHDGDWGRNAEACDAGGVATVSAAAYNALWTEAGRAAYAESLNPGSLHTFSRAGCLHPGDAIAMTGAEETASELAGSSAGPGEHVIGRLSFGREAMYTARVGITDVMLNSRARFAWV